MLALQGHGCHSCSGRRGASSMARRCIGGRLSQGVADAIQYPLELGQLG